MRRIQSAVVAVAAFAAALTTGPAATAAPVVSPVSQVSPVSGAISAPGSRAAYNCDPGYFCIYSDWNGGGTRCQWSQDRKANTADDCSFIQRGQNVRSVWNRTGHRVQYYTQTNYNSRVGSTPDAAGGNLQGSYQIRSFRPQ